MNCSMERMRTMKYKRRSTADLNLAQNCPNIPILKLKCSALCTLNVNKVSLFPKNCRNFLLDFWIQTCHKMKWSWTLLNRGATSIVQGRAYFSQEQGTGNCFLLFKGSQIPISPLTSPNSGFMSLHTEFSNQKSTLKSTNVTLPNFGKAKIQTRHFWWLSNTVGEACFATAALLLQ